MIHTTQTPYQTIQNIKTTNNIEYVKSVEENAKMVKQREGYKFIILEPAKTWLVEDKCAGCGKLKSDWKRSTRWKCCSVECTTKYVKDSTYYGWAELRRAAIKRDGKCVKCGIIHTEEREIWYEKDDYYHTYEIILSESEQFKNKHGDNCVNIVTLKMSAYIVDHIHPIALGGEEWDINNLQTLCIACNKIKTRKDMGKIAQLRIKEQLEHAGQKFLEEVENFK
jgi:5-methylcytosine-specific restriction endonuclease McrA